MMISLPHPIRFALLPVCTLLLLLPAVVCAQVNVTVDLSKPVNVLTTEMVGAYTQMSDGDLLDPQSIARMRAAGLNTITYPTGWDSFSQVYHWSSHSITPKAGNADAPKTPYVNPANDFGKLALAMQKLGLNAIIHVNYGSNTKGSGGADPREAAAWVAYANGSPADTHPLGKDEAGEDWKTTGFWAGLRASAPLGADDGYNFLRINHPEPLHISLWQIGEDEADNGFYGGDHQGTIDMHAPYPASPNDNERRRKSRELSPAFYGEQVAAFATAMKAVDPGVKIGATLTTPSVDTFGSDWNDAVLKAACRQIDFASFAWHPGFALAPDYKTLDDASVLTAPATQLPQVLAGYLDQTKYDCPAGHIPRVVISELSPISWAKMQEPIVPALFAAEAYALLAETGTSNASWFQLREGGLFDGSKPQPAYFGTQMLHIVAFRPGDTFVAVTGAKSPLVVFATRRIDGAAGILLENQDPKQTLQVHVSISGAELGGTGIRFDYGRAQMAKAGGPEKSDVKPEGDAVNVAVPPYSTVDILLPLKK